MNVASNGDQRVANNVMRHAYRVLSDKEKVHTQALKDKGLELHEKQPQSDSGPIATST